MTIYENSLKVWDIHIPDFRHFANSRALGNFQKVWPLLVKKKHQVRPKTGFPVFRVSTARVLRVDKLFFYLLHYYTGIGESKLYTPLQVWQVILRFRRDSTYNFTNG